MRTIMVVDDEADIRFIVREVLEKEGFSVIEAQGGKECLDKIKAQKPDLILLDIMMPGLDGWGVLGEIQKEDDLKSIPVTMFTVTPLTPETLRKKEIDGLVNYIVKPFSYEGLVKSITETLDSLSKTVSTKDKLGEVDEDLAREYGAVSRLLMLHKNFISIFDDVLEQRKGDGSMDDIQSFEDVIRSESMLIDSYSKRIVELEKLISSESG